MTLNLTKQRVVGVVVVGEGEVGWVMDTGEGMCYGECCEVCKPGNS